MSCGRPTDQKLFAGYIRGVRLTTSWGAPWIAPGNHLRAYCDLRVVVWLTVEGLGLTWDAARLFPTTSPKPVPGYPVNCIITIGY